MHRQVKEQMAAAGMKSKGSWLRGLRANGESGKAAAVQHQEVEDVVTGALPQRGSTPRSKSAHHMLLIAQLNIFHRL